MRNFKRLQFALLGFTFFSSSVFAYLVTDYVDGRIALYHLNGEKIERWNCFTQPYDFEGCQGNKTKPDDSYSNLFFREMLLHRLFAYQAPLDKLIQRYETQMNLIDKKLNDLIQDLQVQRDKWIQVKANICQEHDDREDFLTTWLGKEGVHIILKDNLAAQAEDDNHGFKEFVKAWRVAMNFGHEAEALTPCGDPTNLETSLESCREAYGEAATKKLNGKTWKMVSVGNYNENPVWLAPDEITFWVQAPISSLILKHDFVDPCRENEAFARAAFGQISDAHFIQHTHDKGVENYFGSLPKPAFAWKVLTEFGLLSEIENKAKEREQQTGAKPGDYAFLVGLDSQYVSDGGGRYRISTLQKYGVFQHWKVNETKAFGLDSFGTVSTYCVATKRVGPQ